MVEGAKREKIPINKQRGEILGIGGLCKKNIKSYSPSKAAKEWHNIPFQVCVLVSVNVVLFWSIKIYLGEMTQGPYQISSVVIFSQNPLVGFLAFIFSTGTYAIIGTGEFEI